MTTTTTNEEKYVNPIDNIEDDELRQLASIASYTYARTRQCCTLSFPFSGTIRTYHWSDPNAWPFVVDLSQILLAAHNSSTYAISTEACIDSVDLLLIHAVGTLDRVTLSFSSQGAFVEYGRQGLINMAQDLEWQTDLAPFGVTPDMKMAAWRWFSTLPEGNVHIDNDNIGFITSWREKMEMIESGN